MISVLLLAFSLGVETKFEKSEKVDFCENLKCGDSSAICGIRQDGDGYRLRWFENECELLKFGCKVENHLAFGVISMDYCEQSFEISTRETIKDRCTEIDCSYPSDAKEVCGIKKDGEGFRVRIFGDKCKLWKYNCENEITFTETEIHICNGLKDDVYLSTDRNRISSDNKISKNFIVVDSSMINFNNFNESIANFFAATHVFDLPMKEVHQDVNETSRRMLINIFGPVKVFKPWITIPKNISDDFYHQPTLSSCYHKCPKGQVTRCAFDDVKTHRGNGANILGTLPSVSDLSQLRWILCTFTKRCPDTYAPVCGVPGIVAREPNLMFQNHCFMDVAQCKMYWEDKSDTSISSSYIESSFLFCLGDELNGLYRFLPLIRTLQYMGRLKKKGHFRYKFKNMRFFNNLLAREPNLMG